MRRRLLSTVALLGAAGALSGCLAAAAIPIAATGIMGGSEVLGDDDEPANPDTSTVVAPSPRPAFSTSSVVAEVSSEDTKAANVIGNRENDVEAAPITHIPDANPYADLLAAVAAKLSEAEADRRSALLSNPASLRPDRLACPAGSPNGVIIDLDAAGAGAGGAQGALAQAAAALRARGVTIFWLSGRPESDVVPLRTRLVQSGLDANAQDSLLLLPEGFRKQELRQATAEQFCILAIAGDRRGDFDELYDYVRDADRALSLEPLIGEAWFLVPAPFSEEEIANALGS